MATDIDLDKLEEQAGRAERRAAEARVTVRQSIAADAAERAGRDIEWRRAYVAGYDLAALRQEVVDARDGVLEAVRDSDLGRALLRYAIAERVEHGERAAATIHAQLAGIDPEPVTGVNPSVGVQPRQLTDLGALLFSAVNEAAEVVHRQRESDRQQALDAYATDNGRITAQASHVQPIKCSACDRLVAPDAVHYSSHGLPFHDDPACKPRAQFPDAKTLAEEEADRVRFRKLHGDRG